MTLRRFFGFVALLVSFNFLFLNEASNHVAVGLIWLAVGVVALWPDLRKFKFVR